MERLYDFLRRHPTGVDSFWAVFLFGISVLTVAVQEEGGQDVPGIRSEAVIVPVILLLCLVIALRSRDSIR